MNRTALYLAASLACVTAVAMNVQAADVGDPTGAALLEDSRVELVVERYERDTKISDFAGLDESNIQEEIRMMARLSFPVHEKAFLHLDGGATSAADADGASAIIGAGFRAFVYDSEGQGVDTAIFGSVYYVPRIDYRESSLDPSLGAVELSQEESYVEADVGLCLSYAFKLQDDAIVTPYGGIMISMLQGDEEVEILYADRGTVLSGTGDLENDGMVSVFGGLSCAFNEHFSVRVEARLVSQTSISAALSVSM